MTGLAVQYDETPPAFRLPAQLEALAAYPGLLKTERAKLFPYDGEARRRARRRARWAEICKSDQLPNANTAAGQTHRNRRARQYAHWLALRDRHPVEQDDRETSTTIVYGDPEARFGRPRFVRFFKPTTHRHGRPLAGALIVEVEIPHWDHVPIITHEEITDEVSDLC